MECKWYKTCPVVKFNEKGQVSDAYVSRFCRSNFEHCCHYRDSENLDVFDSMSPVKVDKADSTLSGT